MKYLKPTKNKLVFSLIPFSLLIFLIPFLIPYRYLGFMDTDLGFRLMLPSFFVYWLFLTMVIPLANIFEALGLMSGSYGFGFFSLSVPEITIPGFFLLAFIYSIIIYLLLTFWEFLSDPEKEN